MMLFRVPVYKLKLMRKMLNTYLNVPLGWLAETKSSIDEMILSMKRPIAKQRTRNFISMSIVHIIQLLKYQDTTQKQLQGNCWARLYHTD